jgi:hypothetical protein
LAKQATWECGFGRVGLRIGQCELGKILGHFCIPYMISSLF